MGDSSGYVQAKLELSPPVFFHVCRGKTLGLVVLVVELNRNVGHGHLVFLGVPCIMDIDKKRW
jgi:hypothetical protein